MKITVKGQVTIPAVLRRRYGIGQDTEVKLRAAKEGILLTTAKSAGDRFARWVSLARGSATTGLTTNEIMQMTRGKAG